MKEIKKNMKRGISPLVSYILIVVLSVTIGFLVINTLIDRIDEVEIGPEIDYCDDVSISLNGICKHAFNGSVRFNVTSTGSFSVHQFTFGRSTNTSSLQWCKFSDSFSFPIDFGEPQNFIFNLNDDYSFLVDEEMSSCEPKTVAYNGDWLVEIRIVPWIKPEGELISCKSKEIIINENLNGGC